MFKIKDWEIYDTGKFKHILNLTNTQKSISCAKFGKTFLDNLIVSDYGIVPEKITGSEKSLKILVSNTNPIAIQYYREQKTIPQISKIVALSDLEYLSLYKSYLKKNPIDKDKEELFKDAEIEIPKPKEFTK